MKQFFCLLLVLSLLLCGCLPNPLSEATETTTQAPPETAALPTEAPQPTEPTQTVAPTEAAVLVDHVEFIRTTTATEESGSFTAYTPDGSVVWTYETEVFSSTQLYSVSNIGKNGDRYYLVERGSIVALDYLTGQVLWKNSDFIGSPANENCAVFDEDGNLYICGFFSPDLFAVDQNGGTLYRIGSFSSDYYWACGMQLQGNWLTVQLDGGPEGDMEEPYPIYFHTAPPTGERRTALEAAALVEDLFNIVHAGEDACVVLEEDCTASDIRNGYVVLIRSKLSHDQIATAFVDWATGYISFD